MRLRVVRHLVAHARLEHEHTAILELRVQLAFHAEQDVPLDAPVIRPVARAVFDEPHADGAELARAPAGRAALAWMRGLLDAGPVGGAEGDAGHFHARILVRWRKMRGG